MCISDEGLLLLLLCKGQLLSQSICCQPLNEQLDGLQTSGRHPAIATVQISRWR